MPTKSTWTIWLAHSIRAATWRHRHLLTVERIIGFKRGTGGSVGAAYLSATLAKRAFPELWPLRTAS